MRIYFSHNDLLVWTSSMFLILLTLLIWGAHSLASVELTFARGSLTWVRPQEYRLHLNPCFFTFVPRQYVTCEWAGTCSFKASPPWFCWETFVKICFGLSYIYINKEHTDELWILSTYFWRNHLFLKCQRQISLAALNITQTLERTECMTIIVTSAGKTSWILSRCETRWFHGAGMLCSLRALPSAHLPSVWFQVSQQSPWNW